MENPVKQIYKFNQQAGLLDKPYDDFLEASFQIEEALEGFNPRFEDLYDDYGNVIIHSSAETTSKDIARDIVSWANGSNEPLADVDRLDKACDAIVFAFGSIFKLGLNPTQATQALNVVMKANMAKLSMPKDEHGKLMKPKSFVGPEAELQAILEKAKSGS